MARQQPLTDRSLTCLDGALDVSALEQRAGRMSDNLNVPASSGGNAFCKLGTRCRMEVRRRVCHWHIPFFAGPSSGRLRRAVNAVAASSEAKRFIVFLLFERSPKLL